MATEILVSGLCFGEGPRWHDGALWLSDMHALQVIQVSPAGSVQTVVQVPNRPCGLGWLPNGDLRVVAEGLAFPNGSVITPDGNTLIIGETWGRCLTAFDIDASGDLDNRRTFAQLPDGAVPDGICLDNDGGIWSASPTSNECIRQLEGGAVTHRVSVDQGAFACMLGGPKGDTLFILTAASSDPEAYRRDRCGRVETTTAPFARAGYPWAGHPLRT